MAISEPFKTERLLIEPFSKKHLTHKYVSWLNNPKLVLFSEQRHLKHTLETCTLYMKSFEKSPNYFWAISINNSNLGHIGNINAYVDEINKIADIGILIGEVKARGLGYATEAWLAVCDYFLRYIKLRKITAGTIAPNIPMINLIERAGMVPDGRRIRQNFWNGEEVDVIHGAFFRKDWLKKYPDSLLNKYTS